MTNKYKFFVRSHQNKKSRFLCFQKMFYLSFVWAFLVVLFFLVHLQDLPTCWTLLRKKLWTQWPGKFFHSKMLRGRYSVQGCQWFHNLLGAWLAKKCRAMFSANQKKQQRNGDLHGFSRAYAVCKYLLCVVIGSFDCIPQLWLVKWNPKELLWPIKTRNRSQINQS